MCSRAPRWTCATSALPTRLPQAEPDSRHRGRRSRAAGNEYHRCVCRSRLAEHLFWCVLNVRLSERLVAITCEQQRFLHHCRTVSKASPMRRAMREHPCPHSEDRKIDVALTATRYGELPAEQSLKCEVRSPCRNYRRSGARQNDGALDNIRPLEVVAQLSREICSQLRVFCGHF